MKNIFKRLRKSNYKILMKYVSVCTAAAILIFPASAYASVLGEQSSHAETEYAQGTVYNRNTFVSSSVGQQTENYFEYVPNPDVLPIISNGTQVFGKRTVLSANETLNGQGVYTAMGMNADFFSFTTGVPMSNTIVDGHLLTSDTDELISLGFNADGTAFITPMHIYISVSSDAGAAFGIECLNKYRQPYVMYLYTDEFGSSTNAEGSGTNIVLGNVSGEFVLNQPVTATIESITQNDGSVDIPADKLVISVDDRVADEVKARLNGLAVGQTLTITASETTGDERWLNAAYGTGCLGGSLIRNGQLDFEDDIAAPRSAVGIKADGSIIFYTIDGRQSGYSYGVRKETLANRLLELGCVDAVNLDGGGSTQIGGTLPETTDFVVLNSPSESLRQCANFIFLKKMNAADGIPYKLLTYPYGDYLLSGSTIGIWVSAIDSSYGAAQLTEPVVYTVTSGEGNVDENGYATIYGDGEVYISSASGAATGSTMLHSVTTPDSITIKNEATDESVASITINAGESVYLTADSTYQGMNLVDSDEAYTWNVSDASLGTIAADGTFTAGTSAVSGTITAQAGGTYASIQVNVSTENLPTPSPTPRPLETDYPIITAASSSDSFTAGIYGAHGAITSDNISFKIDGKAAQFDFDTETGALTYVFPKGFTDTVHQITVSVTDKEGYSAFKTHQVGETSTLNNPYSDTSGHWAENYISYMSGRNVVSGYDTDGTLTFMPDKSMTRAEFACMICNYLNINVYNYRGTTLPYSDTSSIPDWALMQVQALYSLGIMQGQLNGDSLVFSPNGNITRSEYSVAAVRMLPDGLYAAPLNAIDSDDVPFWALSAVETLLTQGIMNGYTDGYIRPGNNVTRAEAIKILYSLG